MQLPAGGKGAAIYIGALSGAAVGAAGGYLWSNRMVYRLQREGFLEVRFRRGWKVRNLDFAYFDDLYDLRIVLEISVVDRICKMKTQSQKLLNLKDIWLVPKNKRRADGREVEHLDESFHLALVSAAANKEIERVHAELTEKIRIIRRLDFTEDNRIEAIYREHAKILRSLLQRKFLEASKLLCLHIEQSKFEVRKMHLASSTRSAS